MRGYVEKAKLEKHGSCHLFRHTMATLMLEGEADIRFIQAMLGHAIHRATHPAELAVHEERTQAEDV